MVDDTEVEWGTWADSPSSAPATKLDEEEELDAPDALDAEAWSGPHALPDPFDELALKILDVLEAPLAVQCTCCSVLEQRSFALRELLSLCTAAQLDALRGRLAGEDPQDEVVTAISGAPRVLRERVRGWLDEASFPAPGSPRLARGTGQEASRVVSTPRR
ncbi:MAG: hypothetical protein R3B48_30630 [Kofleriaceae bacterium]